MKILKQAHVSNRPNTEYFLPLRPLFQSSLSAALLLCLLLVVNQKSFCPQNFSWKIGVNGLMCKKKMWLSFKTLGELKVFVIFVNSQLFDLWKPHFWVWKTAILKSQLFCKKCPMNKWCCALPFTQNTSCPTEQRFVHDKFKMRTCLQQMQPRGFPLPLWDPIYHHHVCQLRYFCAFS